MENVMNPLDQCKVVSTDGNWAREPHDMFVKWGNIYKSAAATAEMASLLKTILVTLPGVTNVVRRKQATKDFMQSKAYTSADLPDVLKKRVVLMLSGELPTEKKEGDDKKEDGGASTDQKDAKIPAIQN